MKRAFKVVLVGLGSLVALSAVIAVGAKVYWSATLLAHRDDDER